METHNLKNKAGGLGTFNHELVKAFAKLDHGDLRLTLNVQDEKSLKEIYGDKFDYHHYSSLSRHKFFRIKERFDLWHSVNQNTKVEPAKKMPYLLTIHDVNFAEETEDSKSEKLHKLFLEKLQRSTAICYVSKYAKVQAHKHFEIPNVPEHIIHNGNPITDRLDISDYKPTVDVSKPFFYAIGDFLERKNFTSIVRMMALMPEYNLIISGDHNKEYGEEVKKLIIGLGLSNRVLLTNKVDEKGKQYYYSKCRAFLFPSIREGFGLPPIEAMAFGKPVFLANRTSLPEVGGPDAFYWEDFEPNYMRDIIIKGLNTFKEDASIAQKMIDRSKIFSWENAAKKYLELYNSLVK